jgi:hypothetical protein
MWESRLIWTKLLENEGDNKLIGETFKRIYELAKDFHVSETF